MSKKLAVIKEGEIRGGNVRPCPFGLPILTACLNAGDSVDRMTALEDVDEEKRENIKRVNRKVYRHHQEGKRCVFADKIIKDKEKVDCDYGDNAARYSDSPLRASPFYPRLTGGLYQQGLFSGSMDYYSDNPSAQQLFTGIFYLYASTGEIVIQKHSLVEPDKNLLSVAEETNEYYTF